MTRQSLPITQTKTFCDANGNWIPYSLQIDVEQAGFVCTINNGKEAIIARADTEIKALIEAKRTWNQVNK